jgi:hypothetical protein
VSKPSATESRWMDTLAELMRAEELRCRKYPYLTAVERHHPRGPEWGTGTALKSHGWFALPFSLKAHHGYH